MNAERLHALAIALKTDLERTELMHRLGAVQEALQRVMDNPDPGNQEGVGHALNELHDALEQSAVSRFSPSWSGLLREIGYHSVLGADLRSNVDELFQRTQITPWIAKEEIQKWMDDLSRLHHALNNLVGGLAALKIDSQELDGEECEIGFVIPRAAVQNRLDLFADELDEFDSILRTFSEVATGEPQKFEVGVVSSSGLTVYVNTQAAVAAVTAAALERLISVYRQLLEIRKLRTELGAQDVPVEALDKLDEHANTKIADAIDDIALALVLEFYPSEDGRRAKELANIVRNCLRKLANRIDRGYHFDVRAAEPRESAVEEGSSLEDSQESFHLESIRQAAGALRFMHLEGEPVLDLPEKGAIKKAFLGKQRPAKRATAGKTKTKRRGRRSPAKKKRNTGSRKRTAAKAKPREAPARKVASRIASTAKATARNMASAKKKAAPAKKKRARKAK